MAKKTSAGLLLYRRNGSQVFLVHPGGPFWAKRDAGAWSIPKGELVDGEDPLAAARREFREETGFDIGIAVLHPLKPVKQAGGKTIHAWAGEFDCDPELLRSNQFAIEWPPKSGAMAHFPEVDRAGWFAIAEARVLLLPGQLNLLDQLIEFLRLHRPD